MKKELILSLIAVLLLILLMLIFQIIVKETPLFSPQQLNLPLLQNCSNQSIKQIWNSVFKENSENTVIISNESYFIEFEKDGQNITKCLAYIAYKINNNEEVYILQGIYLPLIGIIDTTLALKANVTQEFIDEMNALKEMTNEGTPLLGEEVGQSDIISSQYLKRKNESIDKTLAMQELGKTFKINSLDSLQYTLNESDISWMTFSQNESIAGKMQNTSYEGISALSLLHAVNYTLEGLVVIELTVLNITSFNKPCQQNWTIMKTNCTQEETQLIWNKDINACNITNSIYMQNKTEKCDFDKNNIIGKKDSIRAINLKPDIYIGTEVLNISKIYNTTKKIVIKENNISLVEFEYDFKEPLDLTKITIEKQPDDFEYGYILINGLNYTKTVRIERLDSFSSEVCIIDKEIEDISDFSSKCNSSRETLLDCPAKKAQVSCNITYDKFIVSGLSHSAAKEFILEDDKTTILNNTCTPRWNCGQWSTCIFNKRTRTCTDTNRCNTTQSKPSEQEACTPSPVLCTENWNCTEWVPKICPKDDKQKRNCTDTNNCAPLRNKREETRPCEYKKRSVALIISVIAILVAILSIISGIIYLLLKNKGEENAESANYRAF